MGPGREDAIEVTTDTVAKRGLAPSAEAWAGWLYNGGHAVLCSPQACASAFCCGHCKLDAILLVLLKVPRTQEHICQYLNCSLLAFLHVCIQSLQLSSLYHYACTDSCQEHQIRLLQTQIGNRSGLQSLFESFSMLDILVSHESVQEHE